jgi:hypothetical protein
MSVIDVLNGPAAAEAVWTEVRERQIVTDETYQLNQNGELSFVIVTDGGEAVIKLPRAESISDYNRHAADLTNFESYIVSALGDAVEPAPLEIPQIIESNTARRPYFAMYSQVIGNLLTKQEVSRLSQAERRRFGSAIGSFVAWMQDAIPFETFDQIYTDAPAPIPDRADYLTPGMGAARIKGLYKIDPDFARFVETTYAYFEYLEEGDALEPNMIGHDDLHLGNTAFREQRGGWNMTGVFDFGSTKPSTPERELRNMPPLGSDITNAAIAAYEQASGKQIDRDLLAFWAIGQTVSTYAFAVLRHRQSQSEERHRDIVAIGNWMRSNN